MYEYRQLFPEAQLIVIVNDLSVLQHGKLNHLSFFSSIGVEVLAFDKERNPDKFLVRKLQELSGRKRLVNSYCSAATSTMA